MRAAINRAIKAGIQITTQGVSDDRPAQNLIELWQGEFNVKAVAYIIKTGDAIQGNLIDIRA